MNCVGISTCFSGYQLESGKELKDGHREYPIGNSQSLFSGIRKGIESVWRVIHAGTDPQSPGIRKGIESYLFYFLILGMVNSGPSQSGIRKGIESYLFYATLLRAVIGLESGKELKDFGLSSISSDSLPAGIR